MSARPAQRVRVRRFSAGAFLLGALLPASPASATRIDVDTLIERTCRAAPAGKTPADRERLAHFLLADAGEIQDAPLQWIMSAFAKVERNQSSTEIERAVIDAILDIQQRVGNMPPDEVDEFGLSSTRSGTDLYWLLDEETQLWCVKSAPIPESPHELPGLVHGNLNLRLRTSPDQLNVRDDERLTAGAARVSYQRERTIGEDGSRRHDTNVAVEAALGVVLDEQPRSAGYLFASYDLQRLRTRPVPPLDAGATQRDKDTDILEFGITGFRVFGEPYGSTTNLLVSGNGSVILDFVEDSERLRINLTASPGFKARLPLPCGLDYFRSVGGGLGGRCRGTFRLQVNHFLDRGRRPENSSDGFVLAGGEVGIEFAQMRNARLRPDGGVIAGLTYRFESALHGDVPDIDRFNAFLKYRRWFGGSRRPNMFGIEFGVDFIDGTNPESFADENRILFGAGLIF